MFALCAGIASAQVYQDREGRSFYVCSDPSHQQSAAAKKGRAQITPAWYSWNSYYGCVGLTNTWGKDYSLPGAINATQNRADFAAAVAEWGRIACADIQQAPAGWYRGSLQNVDVQFGSKADGHYHSDGNLCEASGYFLGSAHAFYPPSSGTQPAIAGDIHILEGNWDPAPGLLKCVMQHEIGHSLGLGHNNEQPTSIMYPIVYQTCGFHEEDLTAIRSLYLPRWENPDPPPPPPPPPPGGCEGRTCRGN